MTIRNWQESDEEVSYSWPIAGGLGVLTMASMIGIGQYSDVNSAIVAAIVTVGYGAFLEWAFWGRDPGTQVADLEKYFTPKSLPSNDEIFGKRTYDAKTLKLDGLVRLLEPKSLVSYGELAERLGIPSRGRKSAR